MQWHKTSTNIAAAILAGGRNRRMGGLNKSLIKIKNTSIIQRTVNILKETFEEIFIVTNSPQDYVPFRKDCFIVTDRIKNVGPLGGIFSGLSETTKEAVFFVPCDMLFLHNALIEQQISRFNELNCDCCVPRIGGFVEPLHAVYKKSLKDDISRFLKSNSFYSVKSFLHKADVYYWDLEDSTFIKKIFRNVNTQRDLKEAIKDEGEIQSLA